MADLRDREVPLEMEREEFRRLGHELVDRLADDLLFSFRERPVKPNETPQAVRGLLPVGAVPEQGTAATELLREAAPLLFDHSLFNGHPRFLGYITASASPIGVLGELLAAGINANLGAWALSPMASEIETQCVRWIAEMLGYPRGGQGLLVSGGNMANFVAFLAARRARAGASVRTAGLEASKAPLLVYASSEVHTWLEKAMDLFGHGTEHIRHVPAQRNGAMDVDALRAMLDEDRRRGERGFLLVGTAGTVSTGAVDPLPELRAIADEHGLWFHVDGAYGAFGALAENAPPQILGLREADSVALDPHKWLYCPIEAGCTLVRHPTGLEDAFSYVPPYYRFDEGDEDPPINYYALGLQNTRGFRALKVWLSIRHAGRAGYERMIADDIRLAQALYAGADAHPELEVMTCELSIATFRYVPTDLVLTGQAREDYLNALNETLLDALKDSGEIFLSNALVAGAFCLRACVVNFRTTLDDIEAIPELVAREGRTVHARMGGTAVAK